MMAPAAMHACTRITDGESIFKPFIDYVTNSDKAIISHEIASAKIMPNCD